ncbi:MAG: hypothetical protein A2283_06810 [Lentisphaerae bacterium RIFOXYA12_FULL_48_11]|nr:MAG: hypothetical protein A2283_06810 [Lentisphaerae bacterium RIFOXYA12_FULL_48_11]
MSENKGSTFSVYPGNGHDQVEKTACVELMATGVAHDFNNLLAAIIGNASIVLRNLPAESPLLKNVTQIETSARKAVELTNQLQSCAGKGAFNIETIELNALVSKLIAKFKGSIPGSIIVQYTFRENLPFIKGDTSCISYVITSLLNNASAAILEGNGTITISTDTEIYDYSPRDEACIDEIPSGKNYVYIEIQDTGCGMTDEIRDRIFDPFFTTKIRGQGLGMPVALGIVRAHGGKILVKSAPEKGSTFRVILPATNQR